VPAITQSWALGNHNDRYIPLHPQLQRLVLDRPVGGEHRRPGRARRCESCTFFWRPVWPLLARTGMRKGELLGLTVSKPSTSSASPRS
jgi:hypothetical protein